MIAADRNDLAYNYQIIIIHALPDKDLKHKFCQSLRNPIESPELT